jgi:hypothetical protein
VLVRAIESRDVDTVTRHVYFDAVRASLTNQIVAAYVQRTGIQISPLAQRMAASALADPVLKKLISPKALSELLSATSTIGTIWQIFGNSDYGIGRFEGWAPALLPPQQRFGLTFRLLQWRWRLVGLTLPETVQDLLGDELVKAMPPPPQRR